MVGIAALVALDALVVLVVLIVLAVGVGPVGWVGRSWLVVGPTKIGVCVRFLRNPRVLTANLTVGMIEEDNL